jgi:hypothetical protein
MQCFLRIDPNVTQIIILIIQPPPHPLTNILNTTNAITNANINANANASMQRSSVNGTAHNQVAAGLQGHPSAAAAATSPAASRPGPSNANTNANNANNNHNNDNAGSNNSVFFGQNLRQQAATGNANGTGTSHQNPLVVNSNGTSGQSQRLAHANGTFVSQHQLASSVNGTFVGNVHSGQSQRMAHANGTFVRSTAPPADQGGRK